VEAPTSARVFLASLLLKFGTMGLGRIMGTFCHVRLYLFLLVAVLGFLVCSFLASFQRDCKSLVAYSSVVHMRFLFFVYLGLALRAKGSALLIIISHGYASALAFYIVGVLFHITFTRLLYFVNSLFVSRYFFYSCYFLRLWC